MKTGKCKMMAIGKLWFMVIFLLMFTGCSEQDNTGNNENLSSVPPTLTEAGTEQENPDTENPSDQTTPGTEQENPDTETPIDQTEPEAEQENPDTENSSDQTDPLPAAREEAEQELNSIFEAFKKTDYSEENATLLDQQKADAITELAAAETEDAFQSIIHHAKEAAEAVETLAEAEERTAKEALEQQRQTSVEEIEKQYNEFQEGNNSEEELNKAKTLFEETNNKIKDGGDIDSVKAIVNSFNNDLNNIITERENRIAKEEKDKQDKINEENRKKELENARKKALEEVDKAYKRYAEKDYSISNWTKLKKYYDNALEGIKKTNSVNSANSIVEEVISNMKKVASLLSEAINSAKKEINDSFNEYNSADYTKEKYNDIIDYKDAALNEIEMAYSTSNVKEIKDAALKNMRSVKKKVASKFEGVATIDMIEAKAEEIKEGFKDMGMYPEDFYINP